VVMAMEVVRAWLDLTWSWQSCHRKIKNISSWTEQPKGYIGSGSRRRATLGDGDSMSVKDGGRELDRTR